MNVKNVFDKSILNKKQIMYFRVSIIVPHVLYTIFRQKISMFKDDYYQSNKSELVRTRCVI